MRLWTVHPRYLDPQGLVAAWREALLAQKVLAGETRGYRQHPQLLRFQAHADPMAAIAAYLRGLAAEAKQRGYHFDESKIRTGSLVRRMPETRGQLLHEWDHLLTKLGQRAPHLAHAYQNTSAPEPHPLFRLIPGGIRAWEKS